MAAMLVAAIFSSLAQNSNIMLSSSGKIRTYNTSQLWDVVNDANPGDTIYLGYGDFYLENFPTTTIADGRMPHVLSKPLTIIGLTSDMDNMPRCFIGWSDLYIDTQSAGGNISLEGFAFIGDIIIGGGDSEIAFRNFATTGNIRVDGSGNTVILDRCNIGDINIGNGLLNDLQASNTIIRNSITGRCNENGKIADFNHCAIGSVNDNEDQRACAHISNSYIGNISGDEVAYENCYYMYGNVDSATMTLTNCTNIDGSIDLWSLNLDKAASESYGFVGNDGTVPGVMGGSNPYSVLPSYPVPDYNNSSVTYDSVNKNLNIKVKVLTD